MLERRHLGLEGVSEVLEIGIPPVRRYQAIEDLFTCP